MQIKPLGDHILIEPIKEEEKTKGGIFLPETVEKEIASETMLNAVRRALRVSQQRGGNQVNYADDFYL